MGVPAVGTLRAGAAVEGTPGGSTTVPLGSGLQRAGPCWRRPLPSGRSPLCGTAEGN